jgi:hypothetical protein
MGGPPSPRSQASLFRGPVALPMCSILIIVSYRGPAGVGRAAWGGAGWDPRLNLVYRLLVFCLWCRIESFYPRPSVSGLPPRSDTEPQNQNEPPLIKHKRWLHGGSNGGKRVTPLHHLSPCMVGTFGEGADQTPTDEELSATLCL